MTNALFEAGIAFLGVFNAWILWTITEVKTDIRELRTDIKELRQDILSLIQTEHEPTQHAQPAHPRYTSGEKAL